MSSSASFPLLRPTLPQRLLQPQTQKLPVHELDVMDTGKFLRLRREGTVRDHDGARTIVDPLRRDDLLHRVIADSHVPAKLCLDNLLCISAHHDEVAALIPRPTAELGCITSAFVEPFYERLELVSVEVVEASPGAVVQRLEREVAFALVDEPAEYAVEIFFAYGKTLFFKVIVYVFEMLTSERILLIRKCRFFSLSSPELIDEVVELRNHNAF